MPYFVNITDEQKRGGKCYAWISFLNDDVALQTCTSRVK
jgi:hypothetical protein